MCVHVCVCARACVCVCVCVSNIDGHGGRWLLNFRRWLHAGIIMCRPTAKGIYYNVFFFINEKLSPGKAIPRILATTKDQYKKYNKNLTIYNVYKKCYILSQLGIYSTWLTENIREHRILKI